MRRFLEFTVILTILTTSWACEKEEEQNETPQTEIAATLNLRDIGGNLTSSAWSLPEVSAIRQNGNITVTAHNSLSGEIFTLRVPDDGAAYYTNLGSDNDLGYAGWRQNADAITWYSNLISPNELGDFVMEIDEINENANTLSGTFFTVVHSPENEVENAIFQNGSFSNVPIIISEDNNEITETKLSCKISGINFNPTSVKVSRDLNTSFLKLTAINASTAELIISLPLNALDLDQFSVGSGNNELEVSYQKPSFD
ncbi:MAG TPA: DUF6252 family protein, partial [Cryomorphaceae bacterium]|nr:DUF6252 family protein [Cryomorphaceae bacterium]